MKKPQVCGATACSPATTARVASVVRALLGVSLLFASLPVSGQMQTPLRKPDPAGGYSSSSFDPGRTFGGGNGAAFSAKEDNQRVMVVRNTQAFSGVGVGVHVGLNGAGFDVATPLSGKFNLRAGGDFFSYSDTFATDGTNVNADLHLMSAHAALDWFPFGGRFRLSPGVVVADNNRVRASAVLPGGSTVTLDGSSYISSVTDPLNGSGSVDLRKTAPGLTAGFGNLVPRRGGHFSFPVDVGFIYVGQPRLKVNFTGSACDPASPPATACRSVTENAEFQSSLAMFRARLNKDLNYARFFPELSAGVGYSF